MKINFTILVSLILSLIFYYLFKSTWSNSLITIVGVIATVPVIISAAESLKDKKVSVDLLASIALFVSLIHQEWSSVAFINLMITSARIFGDYTRSKADDAVKSLLKLRPEKVKIKVGRDIKTVDIQKVQVGDIVVVEAGDRIPVDGKIIEGEGSIDQSSLTGESLPVTKSVGQKVLSSTLNLSGSLEIKTEKVGADTTFEKIVSLIKNAQNEKQGIQGVADKFTTIYIVVTLSLSIIIFTITKNIDLILSILLVTCADDIAVSIPMAFWGAIAKAGKQGIIIKGSEYLEGLSNLETVLFDKTGTLTKGNVKTEKIITFNKYKSHEALKLIADLESVSEHPIAKAIIAHAKNDGLKIESPEKFEEYAGFGIKANFGKREVIAGKLQFMKNEKVKITNEEMKIAKENQSQGFQVVYLAVNKKLASILTLADQIRPEARITISALKNQGVKNIVMITGDNDLVAARVAKVVGIETFHANLLPEDKLNYIKSYLKSSKGKVAMVGDGVNDAASLKLADIGIAMGAIGADSAIESADIALMQDNLLKLTTAINLSKYTKNIARQNFFLWGATNALGLGLVFGNFIGPQGAAAYNFATDFLPIFNALRVFRYKIN
ncbi:MAG TPA: cation-translocating P-type ATPase [Patescibacteria group bacterium]|nr:cation-translocating P-type ATPase [Patescibacteria group bacterium]